jgi:hypothetical protein
VAEPPETVIDRSPPANLPPASSQELAFHSDDPHATFECQVGNGTSFEPCSSPWSFEVAAPGEYTGQVRAVDAAGVDSSPATFSFVSVEPEEHCGALAQDETWSTEHLSGVVLTCPVSVPAGITLTIAPGVPIKGDGGGGCSYNVDCSLKVEGTLHAVGTAAAPITFTSINDNSVGGATGSGDPEPGDWAGIFATGEDASIDVEHAKISYAGTGIWAVDESTPVLKNNTFNAQLFGAAAITHTATPTLIGNTSTNAGSGPAFSVSSSFLDAGRLGENSATGGARPVVQLAGTVATSSTLPAQAAAWQLGKIEQPAGSGPPWKLLVPEGKTLTIAPGAVLKGEGGDAVWGGCSYNVDCSLKVEGTLHAVGTAAAPITFTSINDNSVGGATGSGDPEPGDWAGIFATGEDASIDVEHAKISYAGTALADFAEGGAVVRGDLSHNGLAIRACNWSSGCAVDAAYVDWGTGGVPASPAYVCGAVTTSPYLSNGVANQSLAIAKNCDGSPNPWEELEESQDAFNQAVANRQSLCAELGDDVCDAISTAFNCLSGAFDVGAGQLGFPLPNPFSGGVSGSDWKSGATSVASAESTWLSNSADTEVATFGKVVSRGLQIVGVASTFKSLADAYGNCGP